MKKTPLVLTAFTAALVASIAPEAWAQSAPGFQADRFNPSERGSEWFALDTLDLRGDLRPAVGAVGEWATGVYRLKNRDGSYNSNAGVVDQQMFVHVGASLVLGDWIRLGVNVPLNVMDNGTNSKDASGNTVFAPSNPGVGDVRLGADFRILGKYASPFELALGGQYFIPSGQQSDFTGDGLSHGLVRLQAAGEAGVFAYALNLGYQFRAHETFIDGSAYGSGLVYGAAAGLRVADRHLLVGPEIYGEANTAANGYFFARESSPLEALLGLHYTIGEDWRVGAAGGPGITHDLGSPTARVILSFEWVPGYHPPPPPPEKIVVKEVPPPPADKDGDGVPDSEDACPDVAGVKTDDPKTNGCPPDKDKDGIVDSEDACPDVPGVKTDDPKTNGCPPDKDKDGVADADDACPDVPGVKTDNPKTNGCPPDRDGDGVLDNDDACPDAPGPKTDDPKTNGCPKAAVVNGMIKISEQVKFATGSAKILKDSDELMGAVADIFLKHAEIKMVRIEGHTDNVGKPAANKALSQARANSVRDWLVKHGVDKKRLNTIGYGDTKPIDDNATEAGRKNNRRVEFHIEQQDPIPAADGTAPAGGAPAGAAPAGAAPAGAAPAGAAPAGAAPAGAAPAGAAPAGGAPAGGAPAPAGKTP
jgi:OOP family OmpA-OmpF porin